LELDQIIHGNTLSVLNTLPSESIDCVITSPPYWGLRSYSTNGQVWLSPNGDSDCEHVWGDELPKRGNSNFDSWDKYQTYGHNGGPMGAGKGWAGKDGTHGAYCQLCNAWRGELGLEPNFQLYIEHLQTIFDEVYRVLKKTGTCWVDIGDTYASNGNGSVPTKSLCNIPHRFAISMTDSGWIQRNTIIWHKPSCMPSSAKDRFTVDFEYVFLFSKNKKYYFEQQFEAQTEGSLERGKYANHRNLKKFDNNKEQLVTNAQNMFNDIDMQIILPNGRNKRTVWCINPQPFKDAHFAVFPEKLVEPMIKAGCPSAICDSCGYVYTPIQTPTGNRIPTGHPRKSKRGGHLNTGGVNGSCFTDCKKNETVLEYIKCNCNAPTHAGVVLDPFVGSGTTALVARKLGRHYIGIDLNEDYCEMANKRLSEVL